MEALQDIEDRLAEERRKDRARLLLVRFVENHGLTAADLREAAKRVAAREVGDEPVTSKNFGKAKARALGRKIREAREAKELTGLGLGKLLGAKGTSAVAMWERGMLPTMQKYRDGLIKHLNLPKDFFAEAGPPTMRGAAHKPRANGTAAHA
jgi:hypothetical protein